MGIIEHISTKAKSLIALPIALIVELRILDFVCIPYGSLVEKEKHRLRSNMSNDSDAITTAFGCLLDAC